MMKKSKLLFVTALITLPLIEACSQTIYHPDFSYPGDPLKSSKNNDYSGPDDGIDRSEFNMTVYFYLDSAHSEEAPKDAEGHILTDDAYVRQNEYQPVYVMKWYMLAPLEKIPEKAMLKDNVDAADPIYWKFLGYSQYPSCMDESLLWNFETDYNQSNVLKLYGVWVAK